MAIIADQTSSAAGHAQTVKPVATNQIPSFPHLHPQPHTPTNVKIRKNKKNMLTEPVKKVIKQKNISPLLTFFWRECGNGAAKYVDQPWLQPIRCRIYL